MEDAMFPVNNKRVARQKQAPIRVVIANPPYSVNDNPVPYPALDNRITDTYATRSTATLKNSLYDSYIRAIRWASDRIGEQGVIGLVTNGKFIDSNVADGFRACLVDEFTSIYIFNLRGFIRGKSGDDAKREGGNIFDIMTGVAVTILVRNSTKKTHGEVFYHDIGDYLTREEKLGIVRSLKSINGLHRHHKKRWQKITPNAEADWINQRDPAFEAFVPIGDRGASDSSVFSYFTNGIKTGRDAWATSFSIARLAKNMRAHIANFNEDTSRYQKALAGNVKKPEISAIIEEDPKRLHWNRAARQDAQSGKEYYFDEGSMRTSLYRPYTKSNVYTDSRLNDLWSARKTFFPLQASKNSVIALVPNGARKPFACLMTNVLPDLELVEKGQCFPFYLYEKVEAIDGELDLESSEGNAEIIDGYRRKSAITDGILAEFHNVYGDDVTKEDIFYYVYGILHSPEYRERFAADLKKMLPRIPLTKERADYEAFTQAGRDLAELHLNYEDIPPYPDIVVEGDELALDPWELYRVQKMTYARPTAEQKKNGARFDKTRINYNSKITLSNIPEDAHDYIVNGKSALDWILDRYQVKVDKKSGIKNDPNDWGKEHDKPRYILDLLLSVANVSVQTSAIVASLPPLNEQKE